MRRRQMSAVSWRELYRVIYLKNALGLHQPKELLQRLRALLPYRDWSVWQLRRFIARALEDPRSDTLLSVTIAPPTCKTLSSRLCEALEGITEAIIIPSMSTVDPASLDDYLGLAAAMTFCPRFQNGQGIGLSDGRAVAVMAMMLPSLLAADITLRLYALSRLDVEQFGFTAEGIVSEAIARYRWNWRSGSVGTPVKSLWEGYLDPAYADPERLDYCFIAVKPLRSSECSPTSSPAMSKPVAEMLLYRFCSDGLPPAGYHIRHGKTISLSVLRTMVRNGKTVALLAGGCKAADALLAIYRAQRVGGLLFNTLVTDEECAQALLQRLKVTDHDQSDKTWQRYRQRFWAAHLRFAATDRCRTHQEIAHRLKLNPHTVSRLLHEAQWSTDTSKPLLQVQVIHPFPQPTHWLDLEMALLRHLHLLEVRVVQPARDEWVYHSVGEAAAQLLMEWLKTAQYFSVGIGAGRTMRAFTEALQLPHLLETLPQLRSLTFWALHSGPSHKITYSAGSAHLLHSVAMRCFDTGGSERISCRLWQPHLAPHMDAIFVGVGVLDNDERTYLQTVMGLRPEQISTAVGTVLNQPFDDHGRPLCRNLSPNVTVLPLRQLQRWVRQGKLVVAVTCGAHKAAAVLAAFKGNLFNCLVTDRACAEALLNLVKPY